MRNKKQRFLDNEKNPILLQQNKDLYEIIKGQWRTLFFKNDNPIVLEIGCGTGKYTTGLAERFKDKNFIGIDIKGSRMWVGSQYALQNKLDNVSFLRTRIEMLENFFVKNEVDEIFITFPDPMPRKSDIKRRLTSPRFLSIYKKILDSRGIIHVKTDSKILFDYTIQTLNEKKILIIKKFEDLYNSEEKTYHKEIQTTYEKRFLSQGMKIKYLCF